MALDRAILLYQQSRYDLAEKELRRELAANPGHARAHGLLAVSLAHQEKYREALQEARQAIHLGPDDGFGHYALATVLDRQDKLKEAEAAIDEAIRLEPENYYYLGLLSSLHMQQSHWQKGLEAAERALSINPEYVTAINQRARALIKLGRGRQAESAIQAGLALAPGDAQTHANQGWIALEMGDQPRAMEHFREALRLNAELTWAQEGIVEALRSRNFVYGLMLRYFFWMSRLSKGARWGAVLGISALARTARILARTPLAPLAIPFIILYLIFVYLSWAGRSLSDLLLRLDRFGRLVLSRDQIVASNWVGGFLLMALVCAVMGLATGSPPVLMAAAWSVIMVIPLSGTFWAEAGSARTALAVYTVILALVGLFGVALALVDVSLAAILAGLFVLGVMIFSWVANIVITRH